MADFYKNPSPSTTKGKVDKDSFGPDVEHRKYGWGDKPGLQTPRCVTCGKPMSLVKRYGNDLYYVCRNVNCKSDAIIHRHV